MAERDHADTSSAAVHRMTDTEFVMWTLDEDPALRSDFVNVTLLASPPDEDRLPRIVSTSTPDPEETSP